MEGEDIFEIVEGRLKKTDSLSREEIDYLKEKGFLENDSFKQPVITTKKLMEELVKNLKDRLPDSIKDLPITFLGDDRAKDVAEAPAGIVVLHENRHTTMFIKNEINGNTEIFVLDSYSNYADGVITEAYGGKNNCILRYPATAQSINNEEEWEVYSEKIKKEYDEASENLNRAEQEYKKAGIFERVEEARKLRYDDRALEELNLTPEEKEASERLEELKSRENTSGLRLAKTKNGAYFLQDKRKSRGDLGIQKSENNCKFFVQAFIEEICKWTEEKKEKNGSLSTLQALQAVTDGFEKQGNEKFIMPDSLPQKYGESETALKLIANSRAGNRKNDILNKSTILAFKEERERRLSNKLNGEFNEFLDNLEIEKEQTGKEKEEEILKKLEKNEKELEEKRESLREEISLGNNLRFKELKKLYIRLKSQETFFERLKATVKKTIIDLAKNFAEKIGYLKSDQEELLLLSKIKNANQNIGNFLGKETSKQSNF
ncbi:MAG: hypothetical protein LBI70_01565 [Rickettsiales bacterium]|jgi:hypothetical protein|nr:hypothetical protein [Rickettsiales bacterium]